MNEQIVPLKHLDKLKYQEPQPFLRYATIVDLQMTEEMPAIPRTSRKKEGLFSVFLLPFTVLVLVAIGMIWLLPIMLDWVYRLVLSILTLLAGYGFLMKMDTMLHRQEIPLHLQTQQVPAFRVDPLKAITEDLHEETNVYLKRIIP